MGVGLKTRVGIGLIAVGLVLGAGVLVLNNPKTTPRSGDWQSAKPLKPASNDVGTLPRHPIAGDFKPDDKQVDGCKADFSCLEQAFGNLVFTLGPKEALARFDQAIAQAGPIEANCHRIVHTMGSAALAYFKNNVAKAFTAGSESCSSGWYHGILERSLSKVTSYEAKALYRASKDLCDDPEIRTSEFIAYQCVHGMGHGLMITTALDLPLTLEICNMFETQWDRESCKSGIFMENLSSSYGEKSRWLRDDDPIYPCNAIEEKDKRYCYLNTTSRALEMYGEDWDQIAFVCASAETNWIQTCFESYGRDASGRSRQNADAIVNLCAVAGKHNGEVGCIIGAARDVTYFYRDAQPAAPICERGKPELKSTCYNAIGQIVGTFSRDPGQRRVDCLRASSVPENLDACLRGSGS